MRSIDVIFKTPNRHLGPSEKRTTRERKLNACTERYAECGTVCVGDEAVVVAAAAAEHEGQALADGRAVVPEACRRRGPAARVPRRHRPQARRRCTRARYCTAPLTSHATLHHSFQSLFHIFLYPNYLLLNTISTNSLLYYNVSKFLSASVF